MFHLEELEDVVAFPSQVGYSKAVALPDFLAVAVGDVGDALRLGDRWLNVGPAGLIDFGLPPRLAPPARESR